MPAAITYVTTESVSGEFRLRARRDGEERAWEWPANQRRRGLHKLEAFLDFARDSRLLTYHAQSLTTVLSQPEVLNQTRPLLGTLCDLQQGAFLAVAEAPDFDLGALADYLELPEELAGPALLEALPEALAREFARLPRAVQALLDFVLGETTTVDYLQWPEFTKDDRKAPLAALERLVPRVAAGKRAEAEVTGESLPELTEALLSPGGAVAKCHPEYEERPAQIAMAVAVAETLRDTGLLMVEAGTGVGKSLAYLAPAILWARENGKPVLVSTHTRNLQDQLLAQELPLLQQALPVSFRAALLKGRRNYPCLRTLSWLVTEAAQSLFWSERLAAAFLVAWLARSPGGDLETIAPEALDDLDALPALVQRVRSQGDACAGGACPCRPSCRVEQARAQARAADLIVVNHALTLEEAKFPFLPDISRVIFDEAHNLESAATENLAYELSSPLLQSFLSALGGEGKPSGFVEALGRRLRANEDLVGVREALVVLPGLPDLADSLREAGDLLGEDLGKLAPGSGRPSRAGERERNAVRLTREVRDSEGFLAVAEGLARFAEAARDCLNGLEQLTACLREIQESARPELQGIEADGLAIAGRLEELLGAAEVVAQAAGDEENYVTWAEAWERQGRPGWSLRAAPVDVGPLLRELFYDRKEAVVFTSATLSIEGQFRHFRRRLGLGLSKHELREESFPSPFDLERQLLLCVPRDFPDPRDRGFDEHVSQALGRICAVSQGGTLALFTSRARMLEAYEALAPDLEDRDLRPLCQEVSGPRWWLLEQLRRHDNTVLFGLKSFWEGVDVPGSALRCVVLCKLPFAVPDDPIVAARMEAIERGGGNPMAEYYFPEAILGFKQGLGRLIRRRTDRGVVFVLDPRLVTRNYGRGFFRSIQRCGLVRDRFEVCLEEAEQWLRA